MEEMDPQGESIAATPPSEREKLIHDEQTKLTANIVNGVALAFIVGGGVTTMTGLGTTSGTGDQLLRASIWILAGVVLTLGCKTLSSDSAMSGLQAYRLSGHSAFRPSLSRGL